MKKITSIICLLFISHLLYSQQNFFNVPSSDITLKKELFFQQQLNFLNTDLLSSTTLCYGLGHNWEIGANILGMGYNYQSKKMVFNETTKPYSPYYVLNGQKKFDINKDFSIGTGAQFGLTGAAKSGLYVYSNAVYVLEHSHTKLVGGLYATNDNYFGSETRNISDNQFIKPVGIEAGIEQNLWEEKLLFQADFISGKHSLGETVLGAAYFLNKNWVLSSGYQIPTFNSTSKNALVVEFTYFPK